MIRYIRNMIADRIISEILRPKLRKDEHRFPHRVETFSNSREVHRRIPERVYKYSHPWRRWKWHPPYTSRQKRLHRASGLKP